jgi:hypothetical protein
MENFNSHVQIVPDEYDNIIHTSINNPEYGYIKLEQNSPTIKNSWLNFNKRVTLLKGKIEDLHRLQYNKDTILPGKIVIKESLKPFNPNNPDVDLKIAGSTGVICRVDDEPIYRQTFYTTNVNEQDILVQHTNTDEIREVMEAQKSIKIIKRNKKEFVSLDTLD